ncbi:Unknown protein, partial [Striga hermonthica]
PNPCRARLHVRAPPTRHHPRTLCPCCMLPMRAPHHSALLSPQGLGLAHVRPNRAPVRALPQFRQSRARHRPTRLILRGVVFYPRSSTRTPTRTPHPRCSSPARVRPHPAFLCLCGFGRPRASRRSHASPVAHALSLLTPTCACVFGIPKPAQIGTSALPSHSRAFSRGSLLLAVIHVSLLPSAPQSPTALPIVSSASRASSIPAVSSPGARASSSDVRSSHTSCAPVLVPPNANTSQSTPMVCSIAVHPCSSCSVQQRASWADARHSPISRTPSPSLSPLVPVGSGHGSQPFNLTQSSAGIHHPPSTHRKPRLLASFFRARLFLAQGLHPQRDSLALRFLDFTPSFGPHPFGQSRTHDGRYIGLDGSSSMFSNHMLRSSPSSSSDSPGLMTTSVSFPFSSRLSLSSRIRKFSALSSSCCPAKSSKSLIEPGANWWNQSSAPPRKVDKKALQLTGSEYPCKTDMFSNALMCLDGSLDPSKIRFISRKLAGNGAANISLENGCPRARLSGLPSTFSCNCLSCSAIFSIALSL